MGLGSWWDKHVSHHTERKKRQEQVDKQVAEYREESAELRAERQKIKEEKEAERQRMNRRYMRRLKGSMRQSNAIASPDDGMNENLG